LCDAEGRELRASKETTIVREGKLDNVQKKKNRTGSLVSARIDRSNEKTTELNYLRWEKRLKKLGKEIKGYLIPFKFAGRKCEKAGV